MHDMLIAADPDKMAAIFAKPAYAAQDWVHLCTWDYFVGQWIYLQGLEKKIFTRLSLMITFNTGEPNPVPLPLNSALNICTCRSECAHSCCMGFFTLKFAACMKFNWFYVTHCTVGVRPLHTLTRHMLHA
jgi:hypothetical protein